MLVCRSDEDIDMFIKRMGFTVSDEDGNEVKGEQGRKCRGVRELHKLAWDINDGKGVEIEKHQRLGRGFVKSLVMKLMTWNVRIGWF